MKIIVEKFKEILLLVVAVIFVVSSRASIVTPKFKPTLQQENFTDTQRGYFK